MNACPVCGDTENLTRQHRGYVPEKVDEELWCTECNKWARDLADAFGHRDQDAVSGQMIRGFPCIPLQPLTIVGKCLQDTRYKDRWTLMFYNDVKTHGSLDPGIRRSSTGITSVPLPAWIEEIPVHSWNEWRKNVARRHRELAGDHRMWVVLYAKEEKQGHPRVTCYRYYDQDGNLGLLRPDNFHVSEGTELPVLGRQASNKLGAFLLYLHAKKEKVRNAQLSLFSEVV